MANFVSLEASRCNRCGLCVKACPELVFEQSDPRQPPGIVHPERCLGCMACQDDCEERAVRVFRLPEGMDPSSVPPPAQGLDGERSYELVVVGAGPAGLGAALCGRLLGMRVAVVDKLPSSRRAHHPDGGLLFSARDLYTMEESAAGVRLKELDLLIPASMIRDRLSSMMLAGPRGLATRKSGRSRSFISVSKDALVDLLANRARELGATLAYNTLATKIEAGSESEMASVHLENGLVLQAKVVVAAEGCLGRLSERAGIPVNENVAGWSYGLMIDQLPATRAADEFGFLIGSMPGIAIPMLLFWAHGEGRAELMGGTLQKSRRRELPRPLSVELAASLPLDGRLEARLGQRVEARSEARDGCRVLMRRLPRTATRARVLAVGDAITSCGMMTNLAALRSGDLAARVAARAIRSGERTVEELARYDSLVFKLSQVQGMSWMHRILVEAPLLLSDRELTTLFQVLRRLDLSALMRGGIGAWWSMSLFVLGSIPTLRRHPELRCYLDPRAP